MKLIKSECILVSHDPYFSLTDVLLRIRKSGELVQEVPTHLINFAQVLITVALVRSTISDNFFERIGGDQTVRVIEVLERSPYYINKLDEALFR